MNRETMWNESVYQRENHFCIVVGTYRGVSDLNTLVILLEN